MLATLLVLVIVCSVVFDSGGSGKDSRLAVGEKGCEKRG
jgi:hypothetical protein